MSGRVREHLRTNIVGYVAVFLALGGGTAWATHPGGANSISTGDIINGQVFTQDIADNNMTSLDIRDDTLGSGGLQAIDLRADSVGSSEIQDGSVFSGEIADGSITRADIATFTFFSGDIGDTGFGDFEIVDGAVDSNEIRDGGVGGADLAPIVTRTNPIDVLNGGSEFVTATCAADELLIGGGADWPHSAGGIYVGKSRANVQGFGGSWGVRGENFTGATQTLIAHAYCLTPGATGFGAEKRK